MNPFRLSIVALALLAAAFAAPALPADTARPVRVIVPFLGGGLPDGVARIIAAKLNGHTGRPFVVENRPGDDGHFGAELVSKSEPDGYTLLFAPITNYAAAVSLYAVRHYDLDADFAPVTLIANAPHVLAVHPSLPAKTVGELIAVARSRPGQLRWASHGRTSLSRLEFEMFRGLTGVKAKSVPYANSADALPDLLSGNVDLLFDSIVSALPHIQSGRLRGIAVAGARRSPALARLPTVAEAGVKGFEADYWYGILAPDGVGKSVVERLQRDLAAATSAADVKNGLLRYGIEPHSGPPGELVKVMRGETAKWGKVIRNAGIEPE
ncbi:MAG: tripartite tricarboxylate transporter substrate-binding protein [Sulfuricaulis sp.]|nr:tripartite tricarboxylate transporter substrate-binding protein [Sulfuricaulis sp.]